MVTYDVELVDASMGTNITHLDGFEINSFSRVLSGVGQLTGTMSVWDPKATRSNLGLTSGGDREISIFRDGTPVWNGPITGVEANVPDGSISITAREASWYLGMRTLEVDKHYNADLFYIVRALITYAKNKTASGSDGMTAGASINANIPRFNVTTGNAGQTIDVRYSGAARHTLTEIIDNLAHNPDTGFDYRMDYATGSQFTNVQRTFTLGSPSLGVTQTELLTEDLLASYGVSADRERAATRTHTVGSGYTYTRQNSNAVGAGEILTEARFDRSDTANHTVIQNYTREARRLAIPPVFAFTAAFVPGNALPYGWCDLGDKVTLAITQPPMLAVSATRRVVQVDVTPPSGDSPELVELTFNLPMDQLGS